LENSTNIQNAHHFTHVAMTTLFDFIIIHESKSYAQQAVWESIKEIDRLENELSRFRPNSDISRINCLKKEERIVLGVDSFNCINRSIELHEKTFGTFNIACGALLKCWLNPDYTMRNPSSIEIEFAIKKSRIENIVLHNEDFSIEILEEGTLIDLGAFGKGYAIDVVSEILLDWGIENAMLSSGRSSIKGYGNPPGLSGWQVSITNPSNPSQLLKTLSLKNISIGASGLSKGNHIINTITGKPEEKKCGCWVTSEKAADADAFSTAFMILENDLITQIVTKDNSISSLIVERKELLSPEDVNEYGQLPFTTMIS
jgi:FAD:protein FMN transferase